MHTTYDGNKIGIFPSRKAAQEAFHARKHGTLTMEG
jgi:hypothetical protein